MKRPLVSQTCLCLYRGFLHCLFTAATAGASNWELKQRAPHNNKNMKRVPAVGLANHSDRGFSGVDVLSVEISRLHWTWFSPYSGFQVIFTDIGFNLKWDSRNGIYTYSGFLLKSGFPKQLSTLNITLPQYCLSVVCKCPKEALLDIIVDFHDLLCIVRKTRTSLNSG